MGLAALSFVALDDSFSSGVLNRAHHTGGAGSPTATPPAHSAWAHLESILIRGFLDRN